MTKTHDALQTWFEAHKAKAAFIELIGYKGSNTDYEIAKHPMEKGWQHSKGLTASEIDAWLQKNAWIGLIVPEGYVVVDVDSNNIFKHLQVRLQVQHIKHIAIKTPNGGQLFFKDTGKVKTQQVKFITVGGIVDDYRLAGKGYIVYPTANTEDRFILHMDDDLDDMPLFFIPVMKYDPKKHEDKLLPVPILEHISGRDDTLFRHACRVREWDTRYSLKLSDDGLSEVVHQVNNFLCEPCLDEKVVDEKIRQALTYPTASKPKEEKVKQPTQAEQLIEIGEKLTLFHDDTGEAFAELNGHNVKVRSSTFKQWLSRQLWLQEKKAPNSDSLNQALNVLEAKAFFEGEQRPLHNRIALHDGDIYYDMADGRAVKITPGTWGIFSDPPRIFKRHSHQQVQVEAKRGGNLNSVFKYLNIVDEEQQLLTEVLLVSYFVPDIAHPMLVAFGDQGSGKTTISVIFKILVDPSKLSVFFAPRDLGETIQTLEHHYFIAFDNLSDIQDWFSDLLAQVVTGAGLSKRKLYSDDEDIIFQLRRCVAVNGINQLISRPDAMDRSILIHHTRIEPTERKTERELYAEFEHEKPYLLGAIFDALSQALAIYPTVTLPELPRMADFTLWGCAIAQALGYAQEDFLEAYKGNVKGQHSEIISFNTLAQAVLKFMEDKTEWDGTVGDAFDALTDIAKPTKKDRTYPKAPNKLRKHLERLRPNLLEYGLKFEVDNFHARVGMLVHFQKVCKVSSLSSHAHKVNDSNSLDGVDKGVDKNIEKVSSQVSTPCRSNDTNGGEDSEDSEDKIPTLWKGTDSEVVEVPVGVTAW